MSLCFSGISVHILHILSVELFYMGCSEWTVMVLVEIFTHCIPMICVVCYTYVL